MPYVALCSVVFVIETCLETTNFDVSIHPDIFMERNLRYEILSQGTIVWFTLFGYMCFSKSEDISLVND